MEVTQRGFRALRDELKWLRGAAFFAGKLSRRGAILVIDRVYTTETMPVRQLGSDMDAAMLDRLLRALKRWRIPVVPLDEAAQRSVAGDTAGSFVSLVFDGRLRSFAQAARPVLARHAVPFTLAVPTAYPDGHGEFVAEALADVLASQPRVSLVIDRTEQHFALADDDARRQVFALIFKAWSRLPLRDRIAAAADLCGRYGVDMAEVAGREAVGWGDIVSLAADKRVTIAGMAIQGAALGDMKTADATREIAMGKSVLEAALGHKIRHFVYPPDDEPGTVARHEMAIAQAGFAAVVVPLSRFVTSGSTEEARHLPRISWRRESRLRHLRLRLAGL